MGKKGASRKLSSKNNDRGILGIKKAIVRFFCSHFLAFSRSFSFPLSLCFR